MSEVLGIYLATRTFWDHYRVDLAAIVARECTVAGDQFADQVDNRGGHFRINKYCLLLDPTDDTVLRILRSPSRVVTERDPSAGRAAAL